MTSSHSAPHSNKSKREPTKPPKLSTEGITELIIIAADANPLEIVLHLPILC